MQGSPTATIRILLTEDVATDAELEIRELKRAGLQVQHRVVDTEAAFRRELQVFSPDVILSDFSMPEFDGMSALALARELAPGTPFIFVSGTIGEEYAIRALKTGASDYVLKSNLVRLPPAVERAIQEREVQRGHDHVERLRSLEHAVTRRLAEAESAAQALEGAIRALCEFLGWDCGLYFEFDPRAGMLGVAAAWTVPDPAIQALIEQRGGETFAPGEGLPGRIYASGRPLWSTDAAQDERVAQPALVRESGMHGVLGFPVLDEGRPAGVMLCASREVREPDEQLLRTLGVIGSQVGQFLRRKRVEEEQRRFRVALDTSGDMILLTERESMRFLDVNNTICALLGYTRAEMLGMGPQDILADSREDLVQTYDRLIEDPEDTGARAANSRFRCKDGSLLPFEATRHVVRSGSGHIIVVIARDLRGRIAAAEALRKSNERFNLAARATNDVIWDWDMAAGVFHWNENLAQSFGHEPGALGTDVRAWYDLIHPDDRERVVTSLYRVLELGGDAWSDEYRLRRRDGAYAFILDRGHVVRTPEGRATRMIGAKADVTARKEAEARLSYLAQFDTLTGLPNRHLFLDRLAQSLAQAQRANGAAAVLVVDIDRFQQVNDSLGRDAADRLLKEAAARLGRCVRAGDTAGRFSADEFGLVLSDLARPADAGAVAAKVLETLAVPFALDGQEVFVTACAGISLYPADGGDAEALVANAYAAMLRAKEQGGGQVEYFTREMNERSRSRLQTETALRRALEQDEFLLHYQPKADLASGAICGFEALLRWKNPERGLVSPLEFIPVLEDTGLIVPVGEWVIAETCRQVASWRAAGLAPRPVAVNLSARQFQDAGLHAAVLRILGETGVEPGWLQFEITESLLMRDPERAAVTLRALRESGFKLSVDDFGTGYSSLAYLKRFPLDALKIDRAFVREVDANADDAAIASAIIGMAHSLKLSVIAEGVETAAQLGFLRERGCDEMQGYYFSRPLGARDCTDLLAADRRLGA